MDAFNSSYYHLPAILQNAVAFKERNVINRINIRILQLEL